MIEKITNSFQTLEKEENKSLDQTTFFTLLKQTHERTNDQENLEIIEEIEEEINLIEKEYQPVENFFNIVLNNTQKDIKKENIEIDFLEAKNVLQPLQSAIPEAVRTMLFKISIGTLDNSINKQEILEARKDILLLSEIFKKLVNKELDLDNILPNIQPDRFIFSFIEKSSPNKDKVKTNQNKISLIVQPRESPDPYHPSQARINCKFLEKDISLRLDNNSQGIFVDISSKNIDTVTKKIDKIIEKEKNEVSEFGKILEILSVKSPHSHHCQIEKLSSKNYSKTKEIFSLVCLNFLKLLNNKYEFFKKFPKEKFKKFQQEKLKEIYG